MAIDIRGAGEYFRGHAKSTLWPQYGAEQQAGAVAQAKRDLSRELGRPMDEDEPPYRNGERKRDEYAVYEQALHALEQVGVGNGGGSDVPALTGGGDAEQGGAAKSAAKFSPEAKRWLGMRAGVLTVRG